jgi:hypothetical protein
MQNHKFAWHRAKTKVGFWLVHVLLVKSCIFWVWRPLNTKLDFFDLPQPHA